MVRLAFLMGPSTPLVVIFSSSLPGVTVCARGRHSHDGSGCQPNRGVLVAQELFFGGLA